MGEFGLWGWVVIVSPSERQQGEFLVGRKENQNVKYRDKVVVITGASSGVGESTARLSGNGAKVALGARRKDRIDASSETSTPREAALGFKTDVTKPEMSRL